MKYSIQLLIGCFFLCASAVWGQKQMQYAIPAAGIAGISIESDQVFEIFVKTIPGDMMRVYAEVEGETFESLLLDCFVSNGLWTIKTKRSLIFKNIDDKLAAHKVISVVLYVEMPAEMKLNITSELASVKAEGTYSNIMLNLSSGGCRLIDFSGSGTVNTLRGNIVVDTQNAKIDASSNNGILEIENKPYGKHYLHLKSIDGAISVKQSE